MNDTRNLKLLLIALLLVMPAFAAGADAISLRVSALAAKSKPGEPVTISVSVTNESGHPINYDLMQRFCDYSIKVVRVGDSKPVTQTELRKQITRVAHGPGLGYTGRDILIMLKPGESSSEELRITDQYDMYAPGTYTIQVERTFPGIGHLPPT